MTQAIGGRFTGALCDVPYLSYLPESEIALPRALSAAGYQSWHVGKWHLGEGRYSPELHGFDINRGGCGWGLPKKGYFSPYEIPGFEDGPEGEYLTDRLTDEAIDLITRRDRSRPFFLNLWHYAVHKPIQAPADLIAKYERKAQDMGLDQKEAIVEGEYLPFEMRKTERNRRRILQSDPVYAAMIENLDANIGRLLAALEQDGCAGETLVVFTSDNGGLSSSVTPITCNLPLCEGKGWMYDGGTRVSQIVSWPGVVEPGSVCDEPNISSDWYPTLLEAAGLPLNPVQHGDGRSILPLLRGEPMKRGPIFWHYPHYHHSGGRPARAVRDADWKLIEHFEDGRLELFNLREDIGENHDRSQTEPARLKDLHQSLKQWREDVAAILPRHNPNWVPPRHDELGDPAAV
jgi:arylsulfatase A-like enzyme